MKKTDSARSASGTRRTGMFKSVRELSEKYSISDKTVRRIFKRMSDSDEYRYTRDYVRIGSQIRINEESFLRGSKYGG